MNKPRTQLELLNRLNECEFELELLKETSRQIATQLDLKQVLDLVATKAREIIEAETLIVPIIDSSRKKYSYLAASGKNADIILKQSFDIHIGMCGWVLSNQEPLLFGESNPWLMGKKTRWEEGMESALLVPILSRGRIVGGLSGLGKKGGGSFVERDLDLLTLFANQIGTLIENAQIFKELGDERERAEVTLHSIGDAVITTDEKGIIQYMNPVAKTLTAWDYDEAVGRQIDIVFRIRDENTGEIISSTVKQCLDQKKTIQLEYNVILENKNGDNIAIQDSAAPIINKQNNIIGAVLVFHDVTHVREIARNAEYQASHDPLTGLANRTVFEERLNEMISHARSDKSSHVLIYIDLDQFKIVNDTCGHIAGDELLKQISKLFKIHIRKQDLLARLGGDEFGLLLSDCDLEDGIHIAEQLKKHVNEYSFVWKNTSFKVGISVGVVPFGYDTDNYDGLLSAADGACYVAKDLGRNKINVYTPDDIELSKRQGEMRWIPQIDKAIEFDNFCFYMQLIKPVCGPETPRHCEILLRLDDEDGVIVPPTAFIPAAERYNKMIAIDRWVINKALSHISADTDQKDMCYSINVSGQSLSDREFLEYVKEVIDRYSINTENICFEITETAVIAELTQAIHFIESLKNIGCKFSLDDFGSGLSSFAYLKNLPVDYIKIDGMFVKDIVDDPIDRVMVEAIAKIAKEMNMYTIAEFVESEQVVNMLKEMGVDYMQGYHVDAPALWL